MEIDIKVAKQITELADFFLSLPNKLVSAVMGTHEEILTRRARIQKFKELAEIREVGKLIQSMYFAKGNLLLLANTMQMERDRTLENEFRGIFQDIVVSVDGIREAVTDTPISNTELGADISMQLGLAKSAFTILAALPDEAFFDDRRMLEIVYLVERMSEAGSLLLSDVDKHRQRLDCTFGNRPQE